MMILLKLMYIRNDINNELIEVEIQSMQRLKGLKYLIKKLEFDK